MILLSDTWQYAVSHLDELTQAIFDHLVILSLSLGIALLVCLPLAIFASRKKRLSDNLINLIAGIRVIPSLAVLFLVVPYLGLGTNAAVFALAILAMPPIFINTTTAIQTIDPAILESGRGMGMSNTQLFRKVEIPLALPVILSGIQTSAVEVTASATLAAFVGSGGLGIYITRGFAQYDIAILLVGAIPVAALTLLIENVLAFAQKAASVPGRYYFQTGGRNE
jgi:osmoprotectant transport system permease protein